MKSSRFSIKQELDKILKTLELFKEGASIEAIKDASGLDIGHRTLQRRLDKLSDEGIVVRSGKSRATLYNLNQSASEFQFRTREPEPDSIPLSNDSKKIVKILSVPPTHRRPVGYNREFLTSYRPNNDSYLSKEEKQKLTELGKTAKLDQPAGTYAKEILQRLLASVTGRTGSVPVKIS